MFVCHADNDVAPWCDTMRPGGGPWEQFLPFPIAGLVLTQIIHTIKTHHLENVGKTWQFLSIPTIAFLAFT